MHEKGPTIAPLVDRITASIAEYRARNMLDQAIFPLVTSQDEIKAAMEHLVDSTLESKILRFNGSDLSIQYLPTKINDIWIKETTYFASEEVKRTYDLVATQRVQHEIEAAKSQGLEDYSEL